MASVFTRKKTGCREIQFIGLDDKRHAIRLGRVSLKTAREHCRRVELLVEARRCGGAVADEVSNWVAGLSKADHERLVKFDLVMPRLKSEATRLGDFITLYVDERKDAKPGTKEVWRQCERSLVEFLKADTQLAAVTPGDADRYKTMLSTKIGRTGKKLKPMTIRKRLQFATMIFRAAMRRRIVRENPFLGVGVKALKGGEKEFITIAQTEAILDKCPDHHWRSIVALARYGGLRCPSEVLSLRWVDIDWAAETITVQSPKTAHHAGKETRIIPLWPQLREHLDAAFFAPERDASPYVVDERFRQAAIGKDGNWRNVNLRTTFEKIVARAGVPKYPRIFHSLRASRQTELAETEPAFRVCAWLGNSEDVARDHYYLTSADQAKESIERERKRMQESKDQQAQQKAQQHITPPQCTAVQSAALLPEIIEQGLISSTIPTLLADGEGFEGNSVSSDSKATCKNSGFEAQQKAQHLDEISSKSDPELAELVASWASLPKADRAKLLRIVRARGNK